MKNEASKLIWAVKFDTPETALDEEYYFRDAWGHIVNTAVVGDTVYLEPDGDKGEMAISKWYGDKASRTQMTDEIYAILHPSDEKLSESRAGYEDIRDSIVGDVTQTFADEEVYDKTDKFDVKVALKKALKTWTPDLLVNLAEDALRKLGYFKREPEAFEDVAKKAVEELLADFRG